MSYREFFKEENDRIRERYDLSMERIEVMLTEDSINGAAADYFISVAKFILRIKALVDEVMNSGDGRYPVYEKTLAQLKEINHNLYEDLSEHYQESFANPSYACEKLGKEYGQILSFLYAEVRGMIAYAFQCRITDITIINELFIEMYNYFEDCETPDIKSLKKTIYYYASDNTDITVAYRTSEIIDPDYNFLTDYIMNNDLTDIRYLYQSGAYISDNEIEMASYINSISQEDVDKIADTYTEGYRLGFELSGKDLSKKEVVEIRFHIGIERIMKRAIENFTNMGLRTVAFWTPLNAVTNVQNMPIGCVSTEANKQFGFDHRFDNALFIDGDFNERKLGVQRVTYEKYKELAAKMAGPALIELFGEKPFEPVNKAESLKLSAKQQKLWTSYRGATSRMSYEFIKGDERSFTIMALPSPEIGSEFKAIFNETMKVNTLDQNIYEKIQERLIEELDKADYIRVTGSGKNKTSIVVNMHKLENPAKETNFENCLANVNIPLGEVFTSPVLQDTNGLINVSEVFLDGIKFIDLEIELEHGMIKNYSCRNFENEEDNIKLIKDNILFGHDTIPLGEFAIGTNTTAYVMANKYNILGKMPTVMVEKMGPHFAVGDTCYSYEEDVKAYNPDGKEIVAKENEISVLRKTDEEKAYFSCHTDITIPYDELSEITVVTYDGTEIPLITDGAFVLSGTEFLNQPFEDYRLTKK